MVGKLEYSVAVGEHVLEVPMYTTNTVGDLLKTVIMRCQRYSMLDDNIVLSSLRLKSDPDNNLDKTTALCDVIEASVDEVFVWPVPPEGSVSPYTPKSSPEHPSGQFRLCRSRDDDGIDGILSGTRIGGERIRHTTYLDDVKFDRKNETTKENTDTVADLTHTQCPLSDRKTSFLSTPGSFSTKWLQLYEDIEKEASPNISSPHRSTKFDVFENLALSPFLLKSTANQKPDRLLPGPVKELQIPTLAVRRSKSSVEINVNAAKLSTKLHNRSESNESLVRSRNESVSDLSGSKRVKKPSKFKGDSRSEKQPNSRLASMVTTLWDCDDTDLNHNGAFITEPFSRALDFDRWNRTLIEGLSGPNIDGLSSEYSQSTNDTSSEEIFAKFCTKHDKVSVFVPGFRPAAYHLCPSPEVCATTGKAWTYSDSLSNLQISCLHLTPGALPAERMSIDSYAAWLKKNPKDFASKNVLPVRDNSPLISPKSRHSWNGRNLRKLTLSLQQHRPSSLVLLDLATSNNYNNNYKATTSDSEYGDDYMSPQHSPKSPAI